jgi:putative ABC transport system permease protein
LLSTVGNDHKSWLGNIFQKFCTDKLYEGIAGDLAELYDHEINQLGKRKAKLKYNLRVLGFFRVAFSKKISHLKINLGMWRNFLIITLRNFRRHKAYSFINTFGLALGLAAGFMILQYVYYETSYDTFFENKENIYRIQQNRYNKGELSTQWVSGCAGVGLHMKEDFPEVLNFVNLRSSAAMISRDKNYFQPEYAYYAGADFFEVFSLPLVQGDRQTILKEPYTVALSQSWAKKFFGDEDPMGKIIRQNDTEEFVVTGVFEDLPDKSHMKFDLLYSFETYVIFTGEESRTAWQWDGFINYIVLQEGTNYKAFESKLPQWIEKREG